MKTIEIVPLIDRMRKLRKRYRFTPLEQALFYELLALYNEEKTDLFQSSNTDLCLQINISETSLKRARENLVKSKLIYYLSGKTKRNVGRYSFKKITPQADTNTVPQTDTLHPSANNDSNKKGFHPPTSEEVEKYCHERNNGIDAQYFIDFYTAKGWMIGKNKMKDWKAAIRTWEKTRKTNENNRTDNSKPKDYDKGF